MQKSLTSLAHLILSWILPITALLLPLFFLPFTLDFFSSSKTLLLITLASVALVAWTIRGVFNKHFELSSAPATAPLIIMSIIFLISSFWQSPNVRQTLVGETGVMMSLVVIFLTTASTLHQPKVALRAFHALLISASINAVIVMIAFVGIGKIFSKSPWISSRLLNLTGGPIPFLSLSLPLIAALVVYLYRSRKTARPPMLIGSLILLTIASLMSINLLFAERFQFMPWAAGWIVAIRAMQNPIAAVIGTGPNTYADIYTQLKPVGMNLTPAWNMIFPSSANLFLHLLTIVGLGGLVLYTYAAVSMVWVSLKRAGMTTQGVVYGVLLLASLITQLLLPPNVISLMVTFVAMGLIALELKEISAAKKVEGLVAAAGQLVDAPRRMLEEKMGEQSDKLGLLYWFVLGVVILVVGFNGFLAAKAYASETVFYASLKAADKNDGTATYDLQNRAILLNPYSPQYRLAYAQTNFALANAIASQKELSETDKTNVTGLIQQSIREAKLAVQLQPASSVAWQNLASIYRQLIGLVEGADQWTVEAYQQAIALDPTNPQLMLDLGSVYFGVKNYQQAAAYFMQAVQLKQDWPNAYYNLAAAYREAGQPQQALEAMRVVVQLVPPTSADYQKAQEEMNALQKQVESAQAKTKPETTEPVVGDKSKETLVKPKALPSPDPAKEIELPEESAPQASPTPGT
jgi:tetratricopeptide (TPR) repeat protein